MITQVTKGIKISVQTTFEGTFFKNYKMHYAFGYTITIE
ncbi:MAG: Co2+/Mg2+ efflux protein ApaG, partial [Maribacter sp.]